MQAQREKILRRLIPVIPLLLCACLVTLSGCDDDDDDFDHNPPAGMGTMIVDNRTSDHISVFIDGAAMERTSEDSWRPYDLNPGVYRVVLDQQGGDRTFRDDVDILEGRQTILEVEFDLDDTDRFDVYIYFD